MSLPTISAITDSQGVKYDLKDGQARADILDLSSSLSTISKVSLISDDIEYSRDLSVQRLTNEEYNRLVIDGKVNLSTLYIIADDHASFRGLQIKDVGDPTEAQDAATKKYVDALSSELTGYGKTIQYVSSSRKLYLKNGNTTLGTVDCADFIKDGMLSTVQLSGNVLWFYFNTDAGTSPISVSLSSFANVYTAGYGLNLDNGQFSVNTDKIAELSDLTAYYTKSETSSASEINFAIPRRVSQLSNDAGYLTLATLGWIHEVWAEDDSFYHNASGEMFQNVISGSYWTYDGSNRYIYDGSGGEGEDAYYRWKYNERNYFLYYYNRKSGNNIKNVYYNAQQYFTEMLSTEYGLDRNDNFPKIMLWTEYGYRRELTYTPLHIEKGTVPTDKFVLSGEISSEINNQSHVSILSSGTQYSKDLSVIRLTNEEYDRLVALDEINPSAMYVINDTYEDARGKQYKNLSAPTERNDAATKGYVDEQVAAIDVSELDLLIAKNATNIATNARNIVSATADIQTLKTNCANISQRLTDLSTSLSLDGKTYDMSAPNGVVSAVADIIRLLHGEVVNFPN